MLICVGVVVLLDVGVDVLESYMGSSSISSRCSVSDVDMCMGSSLTRYRCRVDEVEGYSRVV